MAGIHRGLLPFALGALLLGACAMPTAVPTPFEDLRPPEDCPPEICPHTPDPTYSARPTGTSKPTPGTTPGETRSPGGGGGGGGGGTRDPEPTVSASSPAPNEAPPTVRPREDENTGIAVLPSIRPAQPFPREAPPPPAPLQLPLPAAAVAIAILSLVGSAGALIGVAWRGVPSPRGAPA